MTAQRVAEEMNTEIGSRVGFRARFQDVLTPVRLSPHSFPTVPIDSFNHGATVCLHLRMCMANLRLAT